MTNRQIHPRNLRCVQPSREAQSLQDGFEIGLRQEPHLQRDAYQPAPSVMFLHLPVDQTCCYLPAEYVPPSASHHKPSAKVGRERVEVEIEPVTGKERETIRSQELSQGVEESG